MTLEILATIAAVLAAIPCGMFLLNLGSYRRLPSPEGALEAVSVLIPARNEEGNLRPSLEALLRNPEPDMEVIVLDDHSTDRTAEIVAEFAARDPRIRCETAPPLPPGWCGKQHACRVLAKLARNSLLLFVDADVRLAPDAVARTAAFMQASGASLASGVPLQETGTVSERLLLPLIHFVLLGFLPVEGMRRTRLVAMSAGCGQLFAARRADYERCGGHSMLRDSLHDGIQLPRVFRRAGLRTDLFDATDLATCRMYRTNGETWRGLAKNATEGIGAPATIVPMTLLLLGGQVLPFVVLALAIRGGPGPAIYLGSLAVGLAWLPRLLAVWRFRQPLGGALLHPLGILALLAIQWGALARQIAGRKPEWKGRSYAPAARLQP